MDIAYEGADALELVRRHFYRLALIGYRLPNTNGLELFQRMRELCDSLEGLLVTGFASPSVTAEAMTARLRDVVCKPVDVPRQFLLVERTLG